MQKLSIFLTLSVMVLFFSSCKKDDKDMDAMKTFDVTIENISPAKDFFASGVFNTPEGASQPGPLMPGNTYSFKFHAAPGMMLSFATMYVQSNDLFYAPEGKGIELYTMDGMPVTGDITSAIYLWDAGTEVNEEPGNGPNQPLRQSGDNTGPAENGTMKKITDVNDGFTYPATDQTIQVTLSNQGTEFTLKIMNLSGSSTPLAPGVWVVHTGMDPLFKEGVKDYGMGLEAIAEDGKPAELAMELEKNSGLVSPLSPGIWVVHNDDKMPLFMKDKKDLGLGLENIAEDGDPSVLQGNLSGMDDLQSGVFNTPDGANSPGVALPGNKFSFSFTAEKGSRLNLSTMLVQSNDLFFAAGENGIDLWNNEEPISGDITAQFALWDAGTELNEFPGAGLNQAPRQKSSGMGTTEMANVMMVNDMFSYPPVNKIIKVTIKPR